MKIYFYLLSLSAVVYLASANKASFITKCKWDDSKCITDSSQAAIPIMADGIPELGVEKMDPLHIPSVDASTSNLKLKVEDITVSGLRNCQATKVERDNAKSKLHVHLLCTVKMTGKYDMKGKLLVLPIEGNGEMRVELNKILIRAEVDLETKDGKDSKKYWSIKKWKHEFELKDKSKVEFDNLFNGSEDLAKAVKDLLIENSNEVVIDIGPEIIKAVVAKVAKNCNNLFKRVPLEELELN